MAEPYLSPECKTALQIDVDRFHQWCGHGPGGLLPLCTCAHHAKTPEQRPEAAPAAPAGSREWGA